MVQKQSSTALAPVEKWLAATAAAAGIKAHALKLALFTGDPAGGLANSGEIAFGPFDGAATVDEIEVTATDLATGESWRTVVRLTS